MSRRSSGASYFSDASIRSKIARQAAHAAVQEFVRGPLYQQLVDKAVDSALQKLGVDTSDPEAMRQDLVTLRDWRETFQLIRRKGISTVVVAMVTLGMTALGIGIGVLFSRHGG